MGGELGTSTRMERTDAVHGETCVLEGVPSNRQRIQKHILWITLEKASRFYNFGYLYLKLPASGSRSPGIRPFK